MDPKNDPILRRFLRLVGSLDLSLLEFAPDFLVVSPPKTGSTWLEG